MFKTLSKIKINTIYFATGFIFVIFIDQISKYLILTYYPDIIYKTEAGKFKAVVEEIASIHETSRPILVGTISIEKSELLSSMLKRRGVPHQVLNAKYHEKEAEIIAQAGRSSVVTIATNMAGRGTDIVLGGNLEFLARVHLSPYPCIGCLARLARINVSRHP